ncbi:uncharacterized protein V6R79_025665 [Siganus canaliculatus]
MALENCPSEDKFLSNDKRCCDRCPAGSYMKAECDGTRPTVCAKCEHGGYTTTKNYLSKCQPCRSCPSNKRLSVMKNCTSQEDTVCSCGFGFHCNNERCEFCQPMRECNIGEGVKIEATRTKDAICAPCVEGTYSNVSDFHSPCRPHTRCEDYGRELKTPGTSKADAICGNFKYHCHWILPAGLWAGLVLTALILFGFMCWRRKCKSYRPGRSPVAVTYAEAISAAPDSHLDLPLPSTENSYCQESCKLHIDVLPVFISGDMIDGDKKDRVDMVDIVPPITPLKASVSFSESCNGNRNAGYSNSFLRTYSEPQEDEYCGT